MKKFGFWNNKGGTGKTSLAFQVACQFSSDTPGEQVLVVDMCPQANISEMFLGGLVNGGSSNLLDRQNQALRATVGGYFQSRLPAPYAPPEFDATAFLTKPSELNSQIPTNIDLVCGDSLLELQANAMHTLANNVVPGTNTWLMVIDWLKDFLEKIEDEYSVVFFDMNPSFSIYTQLALSVCDELVLPVMADDSSRRAIQNAFSLVHGLKLPSEIYAQHNFASHLREANRPLPKAGLLVKNRITQYMGEASGYAAVLNSIVEDVESLMEDHPDIFAFPEISEGMVSIRDFQTTGVVASAHGCPFTELSPGNKNVGGRQVQINRDQVELCGEAIGTMVQKLKAGMD